MSPNELRHALATGPRHRLENLAGSGAPLTTGVYVLWHEIELLYVGMVRKDPNDTINPQAKGLYGRLDTYRRCRLTSDFAIAVAFRYVVPDLSAADLAALRDGTLRIPDVRSIVQRWVRANIEFSCVSTGAADAAVLETEIRRHGLDGIGPPLFNSI